MPTPFVSPRTEGPAYFGVPASLSCTTHLLPSPDAVPSLSLNVSVHTTWSVTIEEDGVEGATMFASTNATGFLYTGEPLMIRQVQNFTVLSRDRVILNCSSTVFAVAADGTFLTGNATASGGFSITGIM